MAPLVKMMDEYYPFLPPAVYGVAPVVAAVVASFLPETLNAPLPDSIEEVESRWACGGRGGMDGGRDGWRMVGWRMDGWRMDGWMMEHGWMEDGWREGRLYDGWMDGLMMEDGWMEDRAWMDDGWMDGWMVR